MSRFEEKVRRLLHDNEEYRLGFEDGAFEVALVQALEAARVEHKISKAELADRMGRKRTFVSRKLNHPDNMEVETLGRFLRSLGMRADIVIREARADQPTLRVITAGESPTRRPDRKQTRAAS